MKRKLAMAAAIMMCLSVFAGCKGNKNAGNNGEYTKIRWLIPTSKRTGINAVLEKANEISREKIGVELDLQMIDSGSYSDKVTMMYASSDPFDLCFTSNWTNDYVTAVSNGGLLELDELIEKNAPGLKEAIPEYIWPAAEIDGKIYGVPNVQVIFNRQAVAVNMDYAKDIDFDLDSVKKLEDLEPYLAKIKATHPDLIPYKPGTGATHFTSVKFEELVGAQGLMGILRDEKTTTPELLYETDDYKHGLAVMRDWYKKGYIREDITSVVDDSADVNAGKYAAWLTTWKPGVEEETAAKKQLVNNVKFIQLGVPYISAKAGMSAMTAVGACSENKEKAIQLIELVNTDNDYLNTLSFGVEGTHYDKCDDGRIALRENTDYKTIGAWMFGNQFNANVLNTQKPTVWKETDEMNRNSGMSAIRGFVFDPNNVKTELSQIGSVIKEYDFIKYGSCDYEDIYNEFMSKLEVAGKDKVYEEMKKQIDEFLANR